MSAQVNLSFYRFYRMGTPAELQERKAELRAFCRAHSLKGTILLAPEGVNVMICGEASAIAAFREKAKELFGVTDRDFKEAEDPGNSFHRMLIKIKKEIITIGATEIKPDFKTAPRVAPKELKRWLDEKKPLVLLDTRNQYEIEVGTFKGAEQFHLDTSREFAAKAKENLHRLEGKTVVTFCTGGIRCEKGAALLQDLGLKDVFQLDGGILRYFEENGAAHYDGQCFVFDWREAVDGELKPAKRSEDPKDFGRHKALATGEASADPSRRKD